MKQSIRYNVFETNSSSEHSLVISKNEGYFSEEEIEASFDAYIDRDGQKNRVIKFDSNDLSFGREFGVLKSYCSKLRYVIAYFASNGRVDSDFEELWEELHARHNWLLPFSFDDNFYYDRECEGDTIKDYGSIDGQSSDLLEDVFIAYNLNLKSYDDIEEFLKNKQYVIITDGDEYQIFDSYVYSGFCGKDKYGHIYEVDRKAKPSKEQPEDVTKMLDYAFHYSNYLDNTCIMIVDCDSNYNKLPSLVKRDYLCDFKDDIDEEGYLRTWGYELSLLTYPKEKLGWLIKLYSCNEERTNQLVEKLKKKLGIKGIRTPDFCDCLGTTIEIATYKLFIEFLEAFEIDEEEFIFNAQYRVVVDGYFFQCLLEAKVLNTNKIIDVFNLFGIRDKE